MPDTEDVPRRKCSNCGQTYHEPVDNPASPEYLWECHVMFECPNPDEMEKARLNASGNEITTMELAIMVFTNPFLAIGMAIDSLERRWGQS